jgi:PAS domain S-box-containing protein
MGHTLAELSKPGFSSLEERVHPDDRGRVREARERFATADESDVIEYEYRAKRSDGQWRWLLVRETLFARGQGGQPKQILGAALDITDRKEAEERLKESEQKLRAIFDQVFQFIGLLKPDGTVLEVNQPALSFARIPLQDVLGRPLWEGRWWWALPAAQKQLKEAIAAAAEGRFVRYETTLQGEEQLNIIADFSVKPVMDADGKAVFLIVEARDITEHKRLEQDILEAASAERRRVGQDLHDGLGQQLAGIALLSRALQQKLASRALLEAQEAQTIVDLANQAVSQSRALARGLCPVDLTEDGLVDALRELAANTEKIFGIPCEFRCESPASVADRVAAAHLFYIAQEAVNNAVKHRHAGTITISLTGGADGISVRIKDDGVGLPKDPAASKGLGLRTMRYRADAIGAFLDIRSVPPRGTIVRCYVRRPKAEPA